MLTFRYSQWDGTQEVFEPDNDELMDAIADDLVAARGLVADVQIALPLEGLLDFDAERERIGKELDKVDKELAVRRKKLANHSFVSRAPADVVDKERSLQQELVLRKERLAKTLANLSST